MPTWTRHQTEKQTLHQTLSEATDESVVRHTLEACTEHAIKALNENIQDDSLYLLFEWNAHQATLTISVSDASKRHDGPHSFCCTFSNLALELAQGNEEQCNNFTESIKFWLHDYLSSCAPFFSYSLVAIFHSSSREHTELL